MTKLFMLNSRAEANDVACSLYRKAQELGMNIEMRLCKDSYLTEIPSDYDIYLLHLKDTTLEAIAELREREPKSKIIAVTGVAEFMQLPEELEKTIDKLSSHIYWNKEQEEFLRYIASN